MSQQATSGDQPASANSRSEAAAGRLTEAWQAHQAGQLQRAERLYQSVLAEHPKDPDALHLLGLLSHQAGRSEAGLELVRAAIRSNPEDAAYHGNLAIILDAMGRLAEAADANRRALAIKPDAFGARFGLANELRLLGEIEDAIDSYEKALGLNPEHPGVLSNLGSTLNAASRHEEAVAYLEQAAQLAPEHARIHSNLGNALQGAGRFEEATSAFRRAIDCDPDFSDAHSNLGVAQLQNGDPEGAIAAFDACLAVEPAHRSALAFKSIALYETGQHARAREITDLDAGIREQCFAKIPGFESVDQFNRALARHVMAHRTLRREPFSKSTRHGQQSDNLLLGEKGPVARLEKMIRSAVTDYMQQAPFPPGHPYRSAPFSKWSLNVWATVLDSQGYQAPHMHPGGWLSGVYYVQLPEAVNDTGPDGWIEFGAIPEELGCTGEHPRRRLAPQTGKLLVFPSYFFHRTIPFASTERRISIAFDVIPEA